jgi:bacterioferritin-associated ferredoxin
VRLENTDDRYFPGEIGYAFHHWRRVVNGTACQVRSFALHADCGYCNPLVREALEDALHRLPRRPAQELRRLVAPLDERFLRLTHPLPSKPPGPWWTLRC